MNELEITHYMKGCKTFSAVKNKIIRSLTNGDYFRWMNDPEEEFKINESKERAKLIADELINKNICFLTLKKVKDDRV